MQYPDYMLYKFFDNSIEDALNAYIESFVETHVPLVGSPRAVRFLLPPFDLVKLGSVPSGLEEYSSIAKAFARHNKSRTFHFLCYLGDASTTDTIKLEFLPSAIPHVILRPICAGSDSKLHIDQVKYRDHIFRANITDVAYCVGRDFRGSAGGIYLLAKAFSSRRLQRLLVVSSAQGIPRPFSGLLEVLNDVLDDGIEEILDKPQILRDTLKRWDASIVDSTAGVELKAAVAAAGLSMKQWLT